MKSWAIWEAAGTPTRSVGNGGQGGTAPGAATHPHVPAVLTVLRAFPCRSRLGDAETAGAVEEEVTRGPVAPRVPPMMGGGPM